MSLDGSNFTKEETFASVFLICIQKIDAEKRQGNRQKVGQISFKVVLKNYSCEGVVP
jgi:hypothetical protein